MDERYKNVAKRLLEALADWHQANPWLSQTTQPLVPSNAAFRASGQAQRALWHAWVDFVQVQQQQVLGGFMAALEEIEREGKTRVQEALKAKQGLVQEGSGPPKEPDSP